MLQQGETDAAGSEACMAFWAPIAAISEIDTRKPGRIDCTRES